MRIIVTINYGVATVPYECELSKDGSQWCVLLGDTLQTGIAGFGNTPALAIDNFMHALEQEPVPEWASGVFNSAEYELKKATGNPFTLFNKAQLQCIAYWSTLTRAKGEDGAWDWNDAGLCRLLGEALAGHEGSSYEVPTMPGELFLLTKQDAETAISWANCTAKPESDTDAILRRRLQNFLREANKK